MKTRMHIAIAPFSFIEVDGKDTDLKSMEQLFNTYSETPKSFQQGTFLEYDTFTNEKVRYNAETHSYTDLEGNKLLSGSAYAKTKIKPFNKELMSTIVGKQHGVDGKIIGEMWGSSGNVAAMFGSSLHLALENYFRNKLNGTPKNYHIPKHPFLKQMVESFPLKDAVGIPEIMISDVANKMVGQVDLFIQTGEKSGIIVDYKSDNDVEKNLAKHSHQLNFYKKVMENKGWKIDELQIWNYLLEWKKYNLELKDVTL